VDEHAARTDAWVVDAHPLPRLKQFDHHAYNGTGGVELSALSTGGIREILDQVFIRGGDQVGKLEVVRPQPNTPEMGDE
jgi:hypothetical protein